MCKKLVSGIVNLGLLLVATSVMAAATWPFGIKPLLEATKIEMVATQGGTTANPGMMWVFIDAKSAKNVHPTVAANCVDPTKQYLFFQVQSVASAPVDKLVAAHIMAAYLNQKPVQLYGANYAPNPGKVPFCYFLSLLSK